ncbi:MAG: mevalonate kinase [Candidatus Poseidoniaceae archaeon]|nr:mevalonate kinase [Candidatus Poseidoniaceae archaeon]
MQHITASAPGKCILFGEHAVVYGHPAVAVAIDQRIKVKIELTDSNSHDWKIDGLIFDPKRHPHIEALKQRLWPSSLGAPALSIHIEGEIPTASGLGSSAALSVAASAALRAARGRWLNDDINSPENWAEGFSSKISDTDVHSNNQPEDSLREGKLGDRVKFIAGSQSVDIDECALLAHAVEAIAQGGRASPMDSSACSHGDIVVLSDSVEDGIEWQYSRTLTTPEGDREWQIHTVKPPANDVYLVIGNTGIHAPTSKQVEKVADMLKNNPDRVKEIETIALIAKRGIKSLLMGDYESVGRAMSENQLMLQSIGVSSPELEDLIRAASPSSLGAKLTGAGGGGCMVALTRDPKATSEAIELAGGRTIISSFGAKGLELETAAETPLWSIS